MVREVRKWWSLSLSLSHWMFSHWLTPIEGAPALDFQQVGVGVDLQSSTNHVILNLVASARFLSVENIWEHKLNQSIDISWQKMQGWLVIQLQGRKKGSFVKNQSIDPIRTPLRSLSPKNRSEFKRRLATLAFGCGSLNNSPGFRNRSRDWQVKLILFIVYLLMNTFSAIIRNVIEAWKLLTFYIVLNW